MNDLRPVRRPKFASEIHGAGEAPPSAAEAGGSPGAPEAVATPVVAAEHLADKPMDAAEIRAAAEPPDSRAGEMDGATAQPADSAADSKPKQAKKVGSSGHRVAWFASLVGAGVVLGLGIVAILKFVDAPSEGVVIETTLEQKRVAAVPTPDKPNLLAGLEIELKYPPEFDTVGRVKNDPNASEQYNIGSSADYSRQISVSVRLLPSGNLDDESSYRLRQIKKSEYDPSSMKINSESVAVMTRADHTEQTMFWVHGTKEVVVSITSNNPKDDVKTFMKVVTDSIRWRK